MSFQAQLPRGGDVLSWTVELSIHLELVADSTSRAPPRNLRQPARRLLQHGAAARRRWARARRPRSSSSTTDLALGFPRTPRTPTSTRRSPKSGELRAGIATADALLIATPEYNGSVPGQLKNALDWASRPFPDNALRHKPAAVVGASTGIFGAVWAQAELRKVLRTAGARVLDQELVVGDAYEAFDHRRLTDEALTGTLRQVLEGLLALTRAGEARGDPRCASAEVATGTRWEPAA